MNLDGKAHSNVLELPDVCLESPSYSEKYSGFVADDVFEVVPAHHKMTGTIKIFVV